MNMTQARERFGERILTLASSEIVRAGIDALIARGNSGRAMDITLAALAEELNAGEWNDVRAIIKRSL